MQYAIESSSSWTQGVFHRCGPMQSTPPTSRRYSEKTESDNDATSRAGALANTISAAEFGRSVGLRDGGYLQALVEVGHVPAQQVQNPKTKAMQYRMTQADVVEFHRKFLTTTTIGLEFGLHRNKILAVLRAAGAPPFALEGRSVRSIWLRDEIERYFMVR